MLLENGAGSGCFQKSMGGRTKRQENKDDIMWDESILQRAFKQAVERAELMFHRSTP